MIFKDFVNTHRGCLEACINTYLDEKIHSIVMPEMVHALHKIKDCVNDGKMIRGMLVILSAQIHGKQLNNEVYAAASAIEIFQTALLIHDDIMDNDHKRRNKDSIFYQYVKAGEKKAASNPLLYGQSMGLCVGDICFFLAFEILSKNIQDVQALKKIISIASNEYQSVGLAQMMDTEHGMTATEPSEEEIVKKYLYKTAHYSFSLPLIVGASFGDKKTDELLRNFGEDIGVIFQLKDDELGMFGDEIEIGKEVGSDIRENKKTLLRWYTLHKSEGHDKEKLLKIFGKKTISPEELSFVRECVIKYGGQEMINKEIQSRLNRIKITLNDIASLGIDISLLQDIVSFNLTRKK